MNNFKMFVQIFAFAIIYIQNSWANQCERAYGTCKQQCDLQYEISLPNYDYACQRGYGWTMSHCCQKSSRYRQQPQAQQFLPEKVAAVGYSTSVQQPPAYSPSGSMSNNGRYGQNKCEQYGGSCKAQCGNYDIIAHALYADCTYGKSYVVNCCIPPKFQAQLPAAYATASGNQGISGIGLGTTGGLTGAGMGMSLGIPGAGVGGPKVKNNFNAPITVNNYGKQNAMVDPNKQKRKFTLFAGWTRTRRGINKRGRGRGLKMGRNTNKAKHLRKS